MTLLQTVKSLINQRLCAAAEDIFVVIERILTDYEHHAYCSKQQRTVLDVVLNADINHRAGFLNLPVCTEELSNEHQESNSSLIQEDPEPPHIKDEQQDILQRQEEDAESPFTLLTVKLEDDENSEIEPLASTSMDHMKTQADVEDCGISQQPTRDDQLFSPHCSKSDTEDSEEWEETREGQPALKSHTTLHVEGQRLPLTNELCEDLKSTKQTLFTRSHRRKDNLSCTVCGEHFSYISSLKQHMRSHARLKTFTCNVCRRSFSQKCILVNHMMVHRGDKPFICTVCEQSFKKKYDLKVHMRIHTGERPFTCIVCERSFNRRQHLKGHMKIHTLQ